MDFFPAYSNNLFYARIKLGNMKCETHNDVNLDSIDKLKVPPFKVLRHSSSFKTSFYVNFTLNYRRRRKY